MRRLANFFDERGTETLEWILIAGIIVAIAVAVYGPGGGTLITALNSSVGRIADALNKH